MILDGLDQALTKATWPPSGRTRIGWCHVTAQVLCAIAISAFVVSLLLSGQGG